jgi:hypothetical protein
VAELWGDLESFKEFERHYDRLHELGKEAVLSFDSDERGRAEALHQEMLGVSERILKRLVRIKEECLELLDEERSGGA